MAPFARRGRGTSKRRRGSSSARAASSPPSKAPVVPRHIELPSSMTVGQLSVLLGMTPIEVIKQLMRNGIMANVNQSLDYHTASTVAAGFGHDVSQRVDSSSLDAQEMKKRYLSQVSNVGHTKTRPPVVTVMGHVDHGKTSILDGIRNTRVAEKEAGAITQHIGAYQVEIGGNKITFIDTPGHQAFTAMRARGAHVTDIAVLVVAADDGVMPQTIEAIDHAKAANVPVVVALNKIDKADTNPEQIKKQLADHGLLVEEWGGDVICIPVSAKTGEGIPDLLEHIILVAEMLEIKANPAQRAVGTIIEATMDKTKGPLVTVLIQSGTLRLGNVVVVGDTQGKVKAMCNDMGKAINKSGPSSPVEILGLGSVPQAGDILVVVENERQARALVEQRCAEKQQGGMDSARAPHLEELYAQIREGKTKELNVVMKADVQGSIAPMISSLDHLSTEEAVIRIIHSDTGSITEGDIMLALASKGIVIGFNTQPTLGATRMADLTGVDIRCYSVIYEMVDEVNKALHGMLEPTYVEVLSGRAEVRQVFSSSKWGNIAGVYVTEGKAIRNSVVKVIRGGGQPIHSSGITSLKRFKDDAKEVATGLECGVSIDGFSDIQVGDIIEFYRREKVGDSTN